MTPEQLQAARAERWRQKQNPALTLDEAWAWVTEMGLGLFLPRRNQFLTPAPSFAEACIGTPSDTPSPAEIDNARGLMIRLTESGTALPLNLLGGHTEQPDFLASREAFPYIFTLRGGRNWKTPPPKATPLVVEIWKLLEPGASLEATEIQAALGRELTEAAVLRGLMDLWSGLRVMPVYTQDGPTRWELTQARFADAMNAANKIAQTTGLSVLVSSYLESVIAATPDEIEIFLSPLTARSKVREVVNGLAATRQITLVPVGTQTMYHVAGSLPEFAEPEQPAEPEMAEPKREFEPRRGFREQRPPFVRERREQRPSSGPPSRERFAARSGDRGQRPRPPREGERRESRPFRKFDPGKRPDRYSPKTRESGSEKSAGERKESRPFRKFDPGKRPDRYSPKTRASGSEKSASEGKESRPFRKFDPGKRPERYSPKARESGSERSAGERKPFRPRPFDDARRGGAKFPPKKFGTDRERPQFGAKRDRPPRSSEGNRRTSVESGRSSARSARARQPISDPAGHRARIRGSRRAKAIGSRRDLGNPTGPSPMEASPGEAGAAGSQFKGQRRDREDQGGRPDRGGQRGKFAGKKFGGPQSRGKSAGGRPGFKSGPKPGGAKPPFPNSKDKKWKNKGKKDDGKNPE